MADNQMFRTPPMPFAELMERCRSLEERINAAARARDELSLAAAG